MTTSSTFEKQAETSFMNAADKAARAAALAAELAAKTRSLSGIGNAPPGSGPYQAYARSLFPRFGWGANQWAPFNAIVMQESGWNPFAQNPTSTAYGIGQFLDTTWATVGATKTSNPYAQIWDMEKYIKQRYGDPAVAEAFHLAHNSYAAGTGAGGAAAGWAVVGENGPEMVKFGGGETVLSNPQASVAAKLLAAGYAKGTTTGLNERINHVLRYIGRHPDEPVQYTNLADHLQVVQANLHTNQLLLKTGRVHGAALRKLNSQIKAGHEEITDLGKELGPFSQTRQWVRHVSGGISTRDKLFASEIAAAQTRHMPRIAQHFKDRVTSDKATITRMGNWLNRVAPVYTQRQQEAGTDWIDSVIAQAARQAGLPTLGYDSGGWLMPGATLAVNRTGKPEQILPPGGQTVTLEYGSGKPNGKLEAAIWDWLQNNIYVKGGGDVQAALGRKA
jgi:SLT domain-containing protein